MSAAETVNFKEGQESAESMERRPQSKPAKRATDLLYTMEEVPPWYLCIIMGLQQYLTAFSGTLAVPLLLAPHFCMDQDFVGISELISTIFFVSGVCTVLQTTIGCRLPIVQGGSYAFILPSIAILTLPKWCCPFTDKSHCHLNETDIPEVGSEEHRRMWQARVTEIQGAIIVTGMIQALIGLSGLIGFLLRFIGPLAIAPTVSLAGLGLFEAGANQAAGFWWISILTILLITLFSQYLSNVKLPFPIYRRSRGFGVVYFGLLKLFPILLAMCISWLVCYVLTASGALNSDPGGWGYQARTDSRVTVLNSASWFYFPYPGQWGVPTISAASALPMMVGVVAAVVKSVGDYYACARLSGVSQPPDHSINRGIAVQGIGFIVAGVWGFGNGTTSLSQNIGAIGITKVASRRVIVTSGLLMVILGCLGKFGALFVTIPTPIVGGMFIVMFGVVTAVGLSTLQFVDLNSSRNLFILGFAIFVGISLPNWVNNNPGAIETGSEIADQIFTVLCSTNMFVGGFCGFFLDNTIPGTEEERGIIKWRKTIAVATSTDGALDQASADSKTYDLPFGRAVFNRWRWTRYFPVCPTFTGLSCKKKG